MNGRFFILVLAAITGLAAPASAQQRLDRPGPVPHAAAATSFPERIGSFRRTNVVQYDANGRDISASYNINQSGGRMLISVYIYPPATGPAGSDRGASCRREFDGAIAAIHSQQRGARVVGRDQAPPIPGRASDLARSATLGFDANFGGTVQPVHSGLFLYCYVGADDWMVKYRVTYNADLANAAALIDTFVRSGPWPEREPVEVIAARPDAAATGELAG